MGPLEQRLGQVAERRGWRLRWRSARLRYHVRQTEHELDIFKGKQLVTVDPVWLITVGGDPEERAAFAREKIAGMVLERLQRRGASPTQ